MNQSDLAFQCALVNGAECQWLPNTFRYRWRCAAGHVFYAAYAAVRDCTRDNFCRKCAARKCLFSAMRACRVHAAALDVISVQFDFVCTDSELCSERKGANRQLGTASVWKCARCSARWTSSMYDEYYGLICRCCSDEFGEGLHAWLYRLYDAFTCDTLAFIAAKRAAEAEREALFRKIQLSRRGAVRVVPCCCTNTAERDFRCSCTAFRAGYA